ncbi:MAG: hypothetical protein PSX37_12050 [bacterium]|nr:hypothetical protein [bacterium]
MGTLRSMTDHSGEVINDVVLGESINPDFPAGTPCGFAWDDARLPNGRIKSDGSIVLDQPEDL